MNKFAIFFSSIIIFLSLCGCSHKSFILSRKNHECNYHIVKSGDTLHSIAEQYNVRLERLVKINNIKVPHTLYDGQKLNLPDSDIKKNYNVLLKKQVYAAKKTPKIECNYNQPNSVKHSNNNKWGWPAHGTIIKHFVNFGPDQGKGIDIIGKKGDPIMSIANGKVVYSGNNLRGYGNLIIIKHNQDFLSAYAHNDKILVKEQQEVVKGQKIATMGDSEANKVVLHFEIRYKGKPIDPLKLLMKRQHD